METVVREGKYIYCIIDSEQFKTFGPLGIGGRGDNVYTVCFERIAAVVSNAPVKEYPVLRENLIPHEYVIEAVMKEHTVLPVRFATITENEEKVKEILEREYDKFSDLLDKLKDKKELGLKAIFKEDVIYKEILEKYQEIKKLKEATASKPLKETYYQCMEAGKMVERALEKEKEEAKEEILRFLEPLSEDVKINNIYGERMIINAAFLINRDKEEDFDNAVGQMDTKYGYKIRFKYVGIVPPFNFVNLVIEAGKS